MPELPDITLYVERLRAFTAGAPLDEVRLASPFLVRTFDPPLKAAFGRRIVELSRLGKRIVWHLEGDLFLVLHLMIAGRLRWRPRGAAIPKKVGLAAFDFPSGTALLTEASSKKRASLHLVSGSDALAQLSRGGVEPLSAEPDELVAALTRENRTLKRALTDPSLVSGIGNAYSDEILHRAGLSPTTRTRSLDPAAHARLRAAMLDVLTEFTARLRGEVGAGFPEQVTAFRADFAVHGRYRQPCPRCGGAVQRIQYASNESNYCPACQTGGKLLADRGLSRLLGDDWPRTLEELEERRGKG